MSFCLYKTKKRESLSEKARKEGFEFWVLVFVSFRIMGIGYLLDLVKKRDVRCGVCEFVGD